MKEIKSIFLFGNGNLAVCDEKGKQVPKLQGNIIVKIFKKARKLGYKLDDEMKILLPGGNAKKLRGYDNYKMLEEKTKK